MIQFDDFGETEEDKAEDQVRSIPGTSGRSWIGTGRQRPRVPLPAKVSHDRFGWNDPVHEITGGREVEGVLGGVSCLGLAVAAHNPDSNR